MGFWLNSSPKSVVQTYSLVTSTPPRNQGSVGDFTDLDYVHVFFFGSVDRLIFPIARREHK